MSGSPAYGKKDCPTRKFNQAESNGNPIGHTSGKQEGKPWKGFRMAGFC
jgi:hypothetical protein